MGKNFYDELDQMGQRYGPRVASSLEHIFHMEKARNETNHGIERSASVHVLDFYTPKSTRRVLEYMAIDYVMFNLPIPEWVEEILAQDATTGYNSLVACCRTFHFLGPRRPPRGCGRSQVSTCTHRKQQLQRCWCCHYELCKDGWKHSNRPHCWILCQHGIYLVIWLAHLGQTAVGGYSTASPYRDWNYCESIEPSGTTVDVAGGSVASGGCETHTPFYYSSKRWYQEGLNGRENSYMQDRHV